MTLAPIILFAYKRPALTKRVLEGLAENEWAADSTLYIYCDGPRPGETEENLRKIRETRSVVREKKWCGSVEIIERESNMGLAPSIVNGVGDIVNRHGRAIVLEDDIWPSPFFLSYMNDALNLYENDKRVLSIGAYNFFALSPDTSETFFIKIPDCWGWAVWKDRWESFELDGSKLYERLKSENLIETFNLNGAYDFEHMLKDQIAGRNSSWAIRWQAVAYVGGKLSLYPRSSVVVNLGFAHEGTHGIANELFGMKEVANKRIKVERIPVTEDDFVNRQMFDTYRRLSAPPQKLWKSVVRRWLKPFTP